MGYAHDQTKSYGLLYHGEESFADCMAMERGTIRSKVYEETCVPAPLLFDVPYNFFTVDNRSLAVPIKSNSTVTTMWISTNAMWTWTLREAQDGHVFMEASLRGEDVGGKS